MEYQQIRTLLDRYFEGTSSLDEEATLRTYFSGTAIDPRLREYTEWFRWVSREQTQQLDNRAAEVMMDRLPAYKNRLIPLRSRSIQWMARIAAVLVLALGVWWVYQSQQTDSQTAAVDWSKYEITNEQEALRITRGALSKASKTLNQGASTAAGQMDRMQEIGKFFK